MDAVIGFGESRHASLCFPIANISHSVQLGRREEIIANDQGHRNSKSWVSFVGEERLIGDAAKNAFHFLPEHIFLNAKRLIYRKSDEPEVKHDMKHWSFKVTANGRKPYIQVQHNGEQKRTL